MKSATKRTRTETEQFYRRLLGEQARSGLSTRAFAAERGVPAGTLSFWRHELKQRDAVRTGGSRKAHRSRFVPVSIIGAVAPEAAPPATSRGVYEVELGRERVVRLPADFDAGRAAALVKAVASC
ncbi:MAG TPA: hypothetical protein VD769_12345 [Gaiellaceae bacterium]|nr:hypothetical protein [Gaiellaceae bacterium]